MKEQMQGAYRLRHPVERMKLRLRSLLMVAGTLVTGFGLVRLWLLSS